MNTTIAGMFRELSSLISGGVLDCGDQGYEEICAIDNGRVDHVAR